MQSCCIRGCDSYKQTTVKNIGYFKFPLHDEFLLNNWLREINRPNWKPSETSQICSAHFKEEDLVRHANRKHPLLFPTSVPTIFPVQRRSSRRRRIGQNIEELNMSAAEIEGFQPHRNKVSLLRRKRSVSAIEIEEKSGVESKLRNVLTKPSATDGLELVSSSRISSQKPFLRITVNKKLNVPTESKPAPFETIFLPYHGENEIAADIKVENEGFDSQNSNQGQYSSLILNQSTRSKSTASNISKNRSKPDAGRCTDNLKLKDCPRARKKTASQNHVFYSFPRTVRVQPLNPKTRQESEQLQKQLDELRKRRKREQLKIVRLQMHLNELEKKMKDNKEEEIVLPNLGEGSKKSSGTKPSWLIREKEEYEKLLKDVREIKLKVLRERHNRELEKIRRLQIQMTNLSDKMRENDEKEIALSHFRATNIAGVVRPDWMKREEEEYEKLLQDVRKIKQSYNSRKTKKQGCAESDSIEVPKSEKVLSNEDCMLIETMQQKSRLMEEIENGDGVMNKIDQTDDNDEYGEVIGLIDEDSIDIDISKEATMVVALNEELPDPGLLDS